MTCADDLRSLWSRSNLHAYGRKFFTIWPPNPVLNLVLVQDETGYFFLEIIFFLTCVYLRGNLRDRLATQRNSLPKFNLMLINCDCLEIRLARFLNACSGKQFEAIAAYDQSDLTCFKCWSCFRFLLELLASFLHAWLILMSGRQSEQLATNLGEKLNCRKPLWITEL